MLESRPRRPDGPRLLRRLSFWSWIGVALLCGFSTLGATSPARLAAKVVDQKGDSVAGARVTITHRKKSSFLKKKTTDKKGRFHLVAVSDELFEDCFELLFEAPGFQPLQTWERLRSGQSLRAVYTLHRISGGESHNLGVEALREGDLAAAERHFRKALETQPRLSLSHRALAEIYYQQRKLLQAIESAKATLAIQPADARALELLYRSHRALGQPEPAGQSLALLIDQGFLETAADLYYEEGVAALDIGEYELAEAALNRSVELQPELLPAHLELARVSIEIDRPADAARAASKAMTIDPENSEAAKLAFKSHGLAGQWSDATEILKQLVTSDYELTFVSLYEWGIELMPPATAREVQDHFENLVLLDHSHARARYLLGLVAERTGDVEISGANLQSFLELAPADSRAVAARYLLGSLRSPAPKHRVSTNLTGLYD